MSLTKRARALYENRTLAARWVLAVRWLRARGKWIADPNTPPPDWAKGVERNAA